MGVFRLIFLLLLLSACTEHGPSRTEHYFISGHASGLRNNNPVTLLLNGSSRIILSTDGTFVFADPVSANGDYAVTVEKQPEGDICTVSNGTGAGVTGDVTSILVTCSPVSYTVSGILYGLDRDQQVILKNNNSDPLILSADGNFTFQTPIAHNGSYAITVSTQPTSQICTVTNGVGAGMVANVGSVVVTCSTKTYKVSGNVTGLAQNQQVTLFNNSADPLILTADGNFTFPTPIAHNGSYAVTVGNQPIRQTCTVTDGSGAGMVADISSVVVNCSDNTYKVGGTIAGLANGQQVTLLNNHADPLIISANGSFIFPTRVAFGGSYAVTVGTHPSGQTCTVGGGSGVGVVANVNSVEVTCASNAYKVGGTVIGLATGQQVTLLNNHADPLVVAGNTDFTFPTQVAYQGSYAVTVGTQPNGQICTVSNGIGAGMVADVNSVAVVCSTSTYTVSGRVNGLTSGQQVTLLNNNADPLTIAADGSFTFANAVAYHGTYTVTVGTQPTGQICTVSNGVGVDMVANVDSVTVNCSISKYSLNGTLTGLANGQQVTLLDNNADPLTLYGDGRFTFPTSIAYQGSYAVTVGTQPTGQTCSVSNGAGAAMVADVNAVTIACSGNTYSVGGTVTGLANGQQVTLLNNNADPLTLSADGVFTFAVPTAYLGSYSVTVGTQPTGQTCTVNNGAGGGVVTNINSVAVTCSTTTYRIGGSVSGLANGQQVTLLNNNADPLTLSANSDFTFSTRVAYNGSYNVTVGTQPTGQVCAVINGVGVGVIDNVTSIVVACSTNTYTVAGNVAGLASGQTLTLLNNNGDPLTLSANGGFVFPTSVPANGSYAVTVGFQPPGQSCTVTNGTATSINSNVTNISVTCSTATYTLAGIVSGLAEGQQITLTNNNKEYLAISSNGAFSFAAPIFYNENYVINVSTQPSFGICTVINGTGAGTVTNINNIKVVCSPTSFTVSGSVTGLIAGQPLTLLNNNADPITLKINKNFTFATPVAYQASYAVTVGTQPPGQFCTVNNGTGAGMVSNATVAVVCSTTSYKVSGTVTGLASGQQVVLFNNNADPLILSANGSFAFPTRTAYNGSYAVTVGTQPIGQICTVNNGSGAGVAADVDSISVICSQNTYTLGGTVTGLASGQQVTVFNNNVDPMMLFANGAFSFAAPVAEQGSYSVTIGTQPTGQTCTVNNGSGANMSQNIINILINCVSNFYRIDAYVGALANDPVTLLNNGGDAISAPSEGVYNFPTLMKFGSTYNVTISRQPVNTTCIFQNPTSGVVTGNMIVRIYCGATP
ncbi:hypothetical protein R8510_04690 [Ralstonia chuxiongensis]|nr:hypothetical protein R8510_04690 [Ralstonia chuxiongensis]